MKIAGKFPNVRLRRVRNSAWIRRLVAENDLSINDLILPIFVRDGKNKVEPIKSMPGINRYSIDKLNLIMNKAKKYKIPMVALFPYTPKNKKDKFGTEALNANNLVCKSLKFIKKRYSGIGVMCDVALDPYTSHGHDGVIINKKIDNDETIKILIKQALLQSKMGCDVIAPSDMMDGRVGAIRKSLDKKGFQNVTLSEIAAYASTTAASITYHFGSKENLLEATMRHLLELLRSEVINNLKEAKTSKQRLQAVLTANFSDSLFTKTHCNVWVQFWSAAPAPSDRARSGQSRILRGGAGRCVRHATHPAGWPGCRVRPAGRWPQST